MTPTETKNAATVDDLIQSILIQLNEIQKIEDKIDALMHAELKRFDEALGEFLTFLK